MKVTDWLKLSPTTFVSELTIFLQWVKCSVLLAAFTLQFIVSGKPPRESVKTFQPYLKGFSKFWAFPFRVSFFISIFSFRAIMEWKRSHCVNTAAACLRAAGTPTAGTAGECAAVQGAGRRGVERKRSATPIRHISRSLATRGLQPPPSNRSSGCLIGRQRCL